MTTIATPLGNVTEVRREGYQVFRGIRYARAPVGERRFAPPVPVDAWTGDYDATQFGASAPQPAPDIAGPLQAQPEPTDEDCLFLNVYTPAADDRRRPVLFWIHGGGYVSGSGRAYNGRAFVSEHDVVVVTINYRMGPIGFMHVGHLSPELGESVNNGILDQICALEWTRDNIEAFGGDPGNVLIFGESAGGTSTAMLVGCPRAQGLFHKAVIHSPHVDLIEVGDGHEAFTNGLVERLGGDPATNGLVTLRSASIDQLIALGPDPDAESSPSLAIRRPEAVGFSPAIDGGLIPRAVTETIRQDGCVPFLGGGCRHEGTLFAQIAGVGECTEAEAAQIFASEGFDGAAGLAVYEQFAPGSTPRQKLTYALTDTMFRNSMVRLLDAAAEAGTHCWSWMCTWETDQFAGSLRATHAIELGFLWAWRDASGQVNSFGGSNPPQNLGPTMRAYWASFARDGVPSAAGEPPWPQHNTAERPVLVLDSERRVEQRLDDAVRRYWFGGAD